MIRYILQGRPSLLKAGPLAREAFAAPRQGVRAMTATALRSFTSEDNGDGAGFPGQSKMDTFAQRPSKEGNSELQSYLETRERLSRPGGSFMKSQARHKKTLKPQQKQPQRESLFEQSPKVDDATLVEGYKARFGAQRSSVVARWLTLDENALLKECQEMGVETLPTHQNSDLLKLLFNTLNQFEADLTTPKAQETQNSAKTQPNPREKDKDKGIKALGYKTRHQFVNSLRTMSDAELEHECEILGILPKSRNQNFQMLIEFAQQAENSSRMDKDIDTILDEATLYADQFQRDFLQRTEVDPPATAFQQEFDQLKQEEIFDVQTGPTRYLRNAESFDLAAKFAGQKRKPKFAMAGAGKAGVQAKVLALTNLPTESSIEEQIYGQKASAAVTDMETEIRNLREMMKFGEFQPLSEALDPVNQSRLADKELAQKLIKVTNAAISLNPNLQFHMRLERAREYSHGGFKDLADFLAFCRSNIAFLSQVNRNSLSDLLLSINLYKREHLLSVAEDHAVLDNLLTLAYETQAKMPNLIALTSDPKFLTGIFSQQRVSQQDVRQVANCIKTLIEIAKHEYASNKMTTDAYHSQIDQIQQKVAQIQDAIISPTNQKLQLISPQWLQEEPKQLLNLLMLHPTPPAGSKSEQLFANCLRQLLARDSAVNNRLRGFFSQDERNYILARCMQVPAYKDLQNDARTLSSSKKAVGTFLRPEQLLITATVMSGAVKEQGQLNNVHYLASLMPPGVSIKDDEQVSFSVLDSQMMRAIRKENGKQLFKWRTLDSFRTTLDTMELQYKYAPIAFPNRGMSTMMTWLQLTQMQSEKFVIPLTDLLRFLNLVLPCLYKPTFMLDEVLAHKQSLAKDVDKRVLNTFIENIISRMDQQETEFDHLTNSASNIHGNFRPYGDNTFKVLQKILSELVQAGEGAMSKEDLTLITKIISSERVATKLFASPEQAKSQITVYLDAQEQHLRSHQAPEPLLAQSDQEALIRQYTAIFDSVRAVRPYTTNDLTIKDKVASCVDLALTNLAADIDQFREQTGFALKKKQQCFPLDQLVACNKSILDAIASLEPEAAQRLMSRYVSDLPFFKIIEAALVSQIYKDKAHMRPAAETPPAWFSSAETNKLIERAIANDETRGKINRQSGPLITHFNQILDADVLSAAQKAFFMQLGQDFLLDMRNSRALTGLDLARFYKLIRQMQEYAAAEGSPEAHTYDKLVMNVTCNLKTLRVNILQGEEGESQGGENGASTAATSSFADENEERKARDLQQKLVIFKMYKEIFERNPALFGAEQSAAMSPLSVLLTEVSDATGFEDHLAGLKMLGTHSMDNYTEQYIEKLFSKYASQWQIFGLKQDNLANFVALAEHWPKFLHNFHLLNELSNIEPSSLSLEDQSKILMIQASKNLINPSFIVAHYQTLIKQTDKERVRNLLRNYLHAIAYVGYTENTNMEQLTQVFRRLYKDPSKVDATQLLDFLVALAVSNAHYHDFDAKSKDFIERALNHVSEKYTGTIQVPVTSPVTNAAFKLYLFNQIPSQRKTFNKVLDNYKEEEDAAGSEKKEFFQYADRELVLNKYRQQGAGHDDDSSAISAFERANIYNLGGEGDDEVDDEVQHAGPPLNAKRAYERGAADGHNQPRDDSYLFKMRNTKLASLAKKDNHLLLYSNVNILDFEDINTSEIARAWTILFHFMGKSIESMLFEEFNSIAQRNTISKTKNHEEFNKFYHKLVYQCYKAGLSVDMAGSCELTGWPIDIAISGGLKKRLDGLEDDMFAVHFLLQEEICYNSETKKEEPLGLQKLMLRHLSQISNYRICTVSENEAKRNVEGAVAKVQQEFNNILSPSVLRAADKEGLGESDEEPIIISPEEEEDDIVDMPQSML